MRTIGVFLIGFGSTGIVTFEYPFDWASAVALAMGVLIYVNSFER